MGFFPTFKNNCDSKDDNYASIRLHRACDNKCIYCIAEENTPKPCEVKDIDKIFATVKASGIKDFVIEGGEPLLDMDGTLKLAKMIKDFDPTITVNVYTSLPRCNAEKLAELMSVIDGINFSYQHWNPDVADALRQSNSKDHDRSKYIRELCRLGYADKIRMSFNLVKGYLDTWVDVQKCLDVAATMGVKFVRLSELLVTPKLYVNIERLDIPRYVRKQLGESFYDGCKTDIVLPAVNQDNGDTVNLRVLIRRACFLVEPTRAACRGDILKLLLRAARDKFFFFVKKPLKSFRVILEDGTMKTSWMSKHLVEPGT